MPGLADLIGGVVVQPGDGPLGASGPGAGVLRPGRPEVLDELIGVQLPPGVGGPAGAGGGPLPLRTGGLGQLVALLLIAGVGIDGALPGPVPLGQVGVPAAAELAAGAGELVQLEDPGDGPGQQRPVVADQRDAGPAAPQVGLEPGQAVVVEVVGRLVEEQDVGLGQQHGGQREPGLLTAGQLGRAAAEQPGGQPQVGGHLARALGQVGAAQREPALQRLGVGVVGAPVAAGQRLGGGVERLLGGGHAGAPGQVLGQRLAGPDVRLLGQPQHGGTGRRPGHRPGVGLKLSGEDLEQSGLPDPVRGQDADAVTGTDGQVDAIEDGESAKSDLDAVRGQPGHERSFCQAVTAAGSGASPEEQAGAAG